MFFVNFVLLILLARLFPSTLDASLVLFQKKHDKHHRVHSGQQQGNVASMPGSVWTHFQCDPKISPFIGVGFGCYCPGTWCSNNADCCSQMCYKKTCY